MIDTLRDSLGRNARFKLGLLLLLVAMLPCYCIGGVLLVVSNNNRRVDPSPTVATAVADDGTVTAITATPLEGRPSITPFSRATNQITLQPTPGDIDLNPATPGIFVTYDTRTLFPPEPVTTLAGTPGNVDSGSPLAQCPDLDGSVSTVIRTNVSSSVAPGANIYCRALPIDYRIGSADLLERGPTVAVDIYALSGGNPVTRFQQPLRVCLLGQGRFWHLDANGQPRIPVDLNGVVEDQYTCANVPNAGTVVLTYR
jgi:hypothetical protein